MTLTRVTITGADDAGCHPADLCELSIEFPFVEWGILFSEKRQGTPRYPSIAWLYVLTERRPSQLTPQLSAHLCGDMARRTLAGDERLLGSLREFGFQRVQLNGFATETQELVTLLALTPELEWILQVRDAASLGAAGEVAGRLFRSDTHVSLLWDASGGRGIRGTVWPEPPAVEVFKVPMGRAGGIGEDNIEQVCREVAALDYESWIDLETGARTDDRFDLGKVRTLLERAKPFVKGSRCVLRSGHDGGHETAHGCICYEPEKGAEP